MTKLINNNWPTKTKNNNYKPLKTGCCTNLSNLPPNQPAEQQKKKHKRWFHEENKTTYSATKKSEPVQKKQVYVLA